MDRGVTTAPLEGARARRNREDDRNGSGDPDKPVVERSALVIALRRATDRHHSRRAGQDTWSTFHAIDNADELAGGFGALERLDESRLQPGARGLPHSRREAAVVTYVYQGTLAQESSTGGSGVIQAGEFQCFTCDRRVRHTERNASQTDWAHIFQLSLRPSTVEIECDPEPRRFSAAERRGTLCIVVSPDRRQRSLLICQDALIHSAILDPGQHRVHELSQGRIAWLHVVHGEALLGDLVLATGDGVGVTAEPAVSLTAREETEILLIDLIEPTPRTS